ncbi:ATP synthase F1 subunit delta [Fulvivirgaceae bacterium BMA10]|uniref:ATP synthase subunit delta n=1 Tax=Splendidivirga corallicola TaxID=3051826 RepID=A0ABT8KTG1_9BACT|nr:ATP synthase F1 subunit delta [Fulvivirgaceae bacterium BMA10]
MSEIRIATRYAKSLLELAEEKGVLEEVHDDMVLFGEVCEDNRNFLLMLQNPIINHDKKLSILQSLFSKRFHELTLAIFELITNKNREAVLPAIARQFHVQYNIHKGIESAKVITTFPLTKELRKSFEDVVASMTGKKVELIEEVSNDIVGGFILKIGDRQIDESISGKLKELKLKFSHNPYLKEF